MRKINHFLIIVLVFLLSACSNDKLGKKKLLAEYPDLQNTSHVFVELDYDQTMDFILNDQGLIIFSFKECPYCQLIMPLLNDVAINEGLNIIYYYDIREIRTNNTEEYQQLLELISSQVDDLVIDDNNNPRIVVPDVYLFKDGKIISHHIATLKDEEGHWKKSLSEEDIVILTDIFKGMMNQLNY